MELFLLLSALIASLTGTARQMVVPAQEVRAERVLGGAGPTLASVVGRALAMAQSIVVPPRPNGYVAPALPEMNLKPIVPAGAARTGVERRRE